MRLNNVWILINGTINTAGSKYVLYFSEELGARKTDNAYMYDYSIDTYYGPLRISVHDDWVACRFEDVERARGKVNPGCNLHSGKWNFHLTHDCAQYEYFLVCLKAILHD